MNKLKNSHQALDPSQFSSDLTGFNCLPHLSTLSRYTSFTDIMTRFNPDIIERLVAEVKLTEMKDDERNCSLLFDEDEIRIGVWRAAGKLTGFTEIGDVNEELL